MPGYTQDEHVFAVNTPLGKDKLLLRSFSGAEAVSEPFDFELDLLAEHTTEVSFDRLLGQPVTLRFRLADGSTRWVHGICGEMEQGARNTLDDANFTFTEYRMRVVPKLWLLGMIHRSRVFQQLSVVDVLRQVFTGLSVSWQTRRTYNPRDVCVQYRETDLAFASRLMEDEGIFYFFKHSEGDHQMVVCDDASAFQELGGASNLVYESLAGGVRDEDRVLSWRKRQVLTSGKVTLRDFCFELWGNDLEAVDQLKPTLTAGEVTHKLPLASPDTREVYEYPGGQSKPYDGIAPGGGEQPGNLSKIFSEKTQRAKLGVEREESRAVLVDGESNVRQLASGFRFSLTRHFNADGSYVLTRVRHSGRNAIFRSDSHDYAYENSFTCLPADAVFRPARQTPRPIAYGPETAVVVGPQGEEIFVDKYGRVKVQFHWDRLGTKDANSFCWLRVATLLSGSKWGSYQFPRVGQEVVVAFENGDPDLPLVTGTVYNAASMPPYTLPDNNRRTGLKTKTTPQGKVHEYHELYFDDSKGQEKVFFQSQKDFHRLVKNNDKLQVGVKNGEEAIPDGSQEAEIYNDRTTTVFKGDDTLWVGQRVVRGSNERTQERSAFDPTAAAGGNQELLVLNDRTTTLVYGNDKLVVGSEVGGKSSPSQMMYGGNQSVTVRNDRTVKVEAGNDKLEIPKGNLEITLDSAAPDGGKVTISAGTSIELKVGQNHLKIDQTSIEMSIPTRSVKLNTTGVEIKTTTSTVKLTDSSAEVSGITAKLSGTATATVSGSGMAELKAALVTIGGGLTKIG